MGENGSTPRELVSSAYQYHNYCILERLAEKFGKAGDQAEFTNLAEKLKLAFNQKFLDPKTHVYQGDTQCGYVLALKFGLVPPDQRDALISNLVDNVLIKNSGHLSVGLIGMQWLMQTLTEGWAGGRGLDHCHANDAAELGVYVIEGRDHDLVALGLDTRDPGMNSEALLIQAGNLDAGFIKPWLASNDDPQRPGFKHSSFGPRLVGDLHWVKDFDSAHGRIVRTGSDRRRVGHGGDIADTTATIMFRAAAEAVTESGKTAAKSVGVESGKWRRGRRCLRWRREILKLRSGLGLVATKSKMDAKHQHSKFNFEGPER